MVFVPVGDQNGPHVVFAFHQVGHVGNYQVNPGHVLRWELDATVDDDNIVARLNGHHVFADFA
jgi:hypothetical protein